jgi:CBS domain-containing protein
MKAKDLMTKDVQAIDKDERLETVLDHMRKGRVSKLVVTEKGRVVGIVTDGDIADELGALKNRGVPASHLHATSAMRRKFPTASPDADLPTLINLLVEQDAGIVPILHDNVCLGVVTASDILPHVKATVPVSDIMSTHVHAVASTDRVIHARRMMVDHHVERLPVLDAGRVVGIVGEGDIAWGLARFKDSVADNHQSAAIQRFLVEDVMQRQVVTTTPETTAVDAMKLMRSRDVGCLPVVRGERIAGIVTRSDLLRLVKG